MSDGPKFYREEMVRARKEHKCCECYSVIPKHQTYHVFVGLWDDFGEFKTCFHCKELRSDINKSLRWDEAICFGDLSTYIQETDDISLVKRYLDIHLTRGILVPDWLRERVNPNKQAVIDIAAALKY